MKKKYVIGQAVLSDKPKLKLAPPPPKEEVKEAVEKAKPTPAKGVWGYKAQLSYTSPELSIDTSIRWARLTDKAVKEKINVVMKSPEGKVVRRTYVDEETGGYRKSKLVYLDTDDKQISSSDVKYYQTLPDGSEVQVQPFEQTKDFKVQKLMSAVETEHFLPTDHYELWGENKQALLQFAEHLRDEDKVAVVEFTPKTGTFDRYLGIIRPVFIPQANAFSLEMFTTRSKKSFEHAMDVETKAPETTQKAQTFLDQLMA